MFCYDTTRISVNTKEGPSNFDPMRCNAVKSYMTHYANLLVLDFMSKNGDFRERAQADEEIVICKRKMQFWERQPHFVHAEAVRQKALLHKTNKHQ
ncbi:MAG: hypothetical protein Q7T25_09465 [Sideroxyarcus sp.]|nr:hypothetical protein [Sideroxyarcus sp.]